MRLESPLSRAPMNGSYFCRASEHGAPAEGAGSARTELGACARTLHGPADGRRRWRRDRVELAGVELLLSGSSFGC